MPLLTLTGPGGVGKTRLALAVAQDVADHFADGLVWVDLAPLRDSTLVLSAIAAALDVQDTGDRSLRAVLTKALRSRHLLLVLDNCEHLLDAAPDIAALLAGCPRLQMLATSRAPLHIEGEQELAVPPLALPTNGAASNLSEVEAVALFLQRARAVDYTFVVGGDGLQTVAEICRRLDGLPLAIELAAAHLKVLTPDTLLARLVQQRRLLSNARRDVPDRHRTLWDTVQWSYDLLNQREQALLRRLAVFVGGFTLEAAEAVADDRTSDEVERASSSLIERLTALVDQSLLQRIEQSGGEPCFGMLETVHAFALEQLEASAEADDIRRRHAQWCLQLAEWAAVKEWQPEMRARLRRVAEDLDNIRAALAWAFECADPTLGIRLAVAMATYWTVRGPLGEGRAWLERAMALTPNAWTPVQRARVCYGAASVISRQQDYVIAEDLYSKSLQLYEASGDRYGAAEALFFLAHIRQQQHASGDPRGTAPLFARAAEICREVDHPLLGYVLANIGLVAQKCGDEARAAHRFHEAAAIFAAHGDQWGSALAKSFLTVLALDQGEAQPAAALAAAALRLSQEEGDRISVLEAVFNVARAAAMLGQGEASGALLGAADRQFEMLGLLPDPSYLANRERAIADLRRMMGQDRTAALVLAGQALSFDQAAGSALALADSLSTIDIQRTSRGRKFAGLSAREQEILRLIAAGRSNADIAAALFIAPRTVSTHASHILNKLGLESRAELIAFAHRENLA